MEHVQGIHLINICDHLDSSVWVEIVESAGSLVSRVNQLNFLNYDVHPSHLIAREVNDHNELHYEPVMIDFAISRIRGEDETDENWYEANLSWDEKKYYW